MSKPKFERRLKEALKKEKDAASRERLSKIEAEVANLRAEGDALKARWQLETRQNLDVKVPIPD